MINYILNQAGNYYEINVPYNIFYLNKSSNLNLPAYCAYKNNKEKEIKINGLHYYYLNFLRKKSKYETTFKYVQATLHEFWHAHQFMQIENSIGKGIFNKNNYQLLNNILVSQYFPDFHQQYCNYFESEIDANINANNIFLNNINNPLFRLYQNNVNYLKSIINKYENNRLDERYNMVFEKLELIDFANCRSKLLTDFSLMEYYFLKDYPIAQLVESKDNIIEILTEKMLEKNDFNWGVKNVKATQDFFDYLIIKKIEHHPNLDHLFKNVRLDTAYKIKNILNSSQPKSLVLKKSRN